jgi:hypothetical protein
MKEDGSLEKIQVDRGSPCHESGEDDCKEKSLPGVADMAKGLAKAGVAWAKAGFKLADEQEHGRRWSICQVCDRLTDEKRCTRCGCFMEIKSRLAGMKCPDGRW